MVRLSVINNLLSASRKAGFGHLYKEPVHRRVSIGDALVITSVGRLYALEQRLNFTEVQTSKLPQNISDYTKAISVLDDNSQFEKEMLQRYRYLYY